MALFTIGTGGGRLCAIVIMPKLNSSAVVLMSNAQQPQGFEEKEEEQSQVKKKPFSAVRFSSRLSRI